MNPIEIDVEVRYKGEKFNYYTFNVRNVQNKDLDFYTGGYRDKGELSIGINNRLCSIFSGIHIRTKQIAQKYLEDNILNWKKKWGDEVEITLSIWEVSDRKAYFKVLEHTDIVLGRLKI